MTQRLSNELRRMTTDRLERQENCQCRYIEIAENYKKRKTSQKLKMLPHISVIYFTIYLSYIVPRNIPHIIFFKKNRKHTAIYLIWGFHIADYLDICDEHSQIYSHQIFL